MIHSIFSFSITLLGYTFSIGYLMSLGMTLLLLLFGYFISQCSKRKYRKVERRMASAPLPNPASGRFKCQVRMSRCWNVCAMLIETVWLVAIVTMVGSNFTAQYTTSLVYPYVPVIVTTTTMMPTTTYGPTTGFKEQPTLVSKSHDSVKIAFMPNAAKDVKCGAFPDGVTAPTADEVYAGTGNGGAGVGSGSGPAVSVVTGANNMTRVEILLTISSLNPSQAYDIYCATDDDTKVLSDKLDVTIRAYTGYTAQPNLMSATATSLTLTVTPTQAVDVKCGAFARGALSPTANEVYAGTGAGGVGVGVMNGPVVVVVTGSNGGAATPISMTISSLVDGTDYDVYCATNDGTKVLSDKVEATAVDPIVTTTPAPTTTTTTEAAITTLPSKVTVTHPLIPELVRSYVSLILLENESIKEYGFYGLVACNALSLLATIAWIFTSRCRAVKPPQCLIWLFAFSTSVMVYPGMMAFYVMLQCDDPSLLDTPQTVKTGAVKYMPELECYGMMHAIYTGTALLTTVFNFTFAIWWSRVSLAYDKFQYTVRVVPWFQHTRLAVYLVLVASYYITQKHANKLYPFIAPPLLSGFMAYLVARYQPNYGNIKIKKKKIGGAEAHIMNSVMVSVYCSVFVYGVAMAVSEYLYMLEFMYVGIGTGGIFVTMLTFNLCLGTNASRDRKRMTKLMNTIQKEYAKTNFDKVVDVLSSLDDDNELNSIDDLMLRSETHEENTLIVVQEYMDLLLPMLDGESEHVCVQVISTFGIAARVGLLKENDEINEIIDALPFDKIIKVAVPLLKDGTSSNAVKSRRRMMQAMKAKMNVSEDSLTNRETSQPEDVQLASVGSMSTTTRSSSATRSTVSQTPGKSPVTRKAAKSKQIAWPEDDVGIELIDSTPKKKKKRPPPIKWEKEIMNFYKKNSPDKADKGHVQKLLEINKGREYEMAARLYSKYDLPVPKKFLVSAQEELGEEESGPRKPSCASKCCKCLACLCRLVGRCLHCLLCCCCRKKKNSGKYTPTGDSTVSSFFGGPPQDKMDATQNLQCLIAHAIAYMAEANEKMVKEASVVSIVSSLIVHCGEHQPEELRAACLRCLSVLSHKNNPVCKMISSKGTSCNTIVAMTWHKNDAISVHALQIMGNAGLIFRGPWKKAGASSAATGVFLAEMAEEKARTEKLAACLHAVARLTQGDAEAQEEFAKKGGLKDLGLLFERHISEAPDIVVSAIPYALVGLTSSVALSGELDKHKLINLMIDSFMDAAFDGALSMDLISRAAGGGAMDLTATSIIVMGHRKSLMENFCSNLEKALSQACDARPTTKVKATMILSKVSESAGDPYKKSRAEELMSRVMEYVPPDNERKLAKERKRRKVAVFKQKAKKVERAVVEEFHMIEKKICCCFKKNVSVSTLEEGETHMKLESDGNVFLPARGGSKDNVKTSLQRSSSTRAGPRPPMIKTQRTGSPLKPGKSPTKYAVSPK